MIKPFTKALTLLFLSATLFTACKKDKEETLTVSEETLPGIYTLGSIKIGGEDVTNQLGIDACEIDNQYTIRADNTYKYEDVGKKCDPVDDYEGLWFLDNNVLEFDGWEGPIKKLTNKALVIEQVESGITYTITFNRK